MKSKKKRSTLSKPLNSKPSKSRSKVLIAIIILIVIGYLVWSQSSNDTDKPVIKSTPAAAEQVAPKPVEDGSGLGNNIDPVDEGNETSDAQTSDSDTILNAPLPETDSLAKEEIDRLEDEQQRLVEQEKLAVEQVTMNKKLTDMKAEQIELLEQQIAQLEADTVAKNSAQ